MTERRFPKMTAEQKKLVEENINLVYDFANRFKANRDDIDELFINFCEAAIIYEPEKAEFSTFANIYLRHELFKKKRNKFEIVYVDKDELMEFFGGTNKQDEIREFHLKEDIKDFLKKIKSTKNRLVFLMYLNSYSLSEIGRYFGVSRQRISQILIPIIAEAKIYFKDWSA